MALTRQVSINGEVRGYHELVMLQSVYGQHIVATVEHFTSQASKGEGEEPYDSYHEIPWKDGITWVEAESAVWALPEYEEWTDTAAGLDEVLAILTDEQAETVATLFPKWKVGVEYKKDARVQYDEKLYRCEQAHTSEEGWEPDKTPALWTRIAKEGEIPEWVQPTGAQDAYNKGDKVKHNGKTWESTYDGANVWEPGVYGWDEVES